MKVNIKKLSDSAVIPTKAHNTDAGFDITAITKEFEHLPDGQKIISYGTGLAIEIPNNYVGLIFPRSSIYKKSLTLANCVGVIDSGFIGEIKFKFKIDSGSRPMYGATYDIGDRVGQLIIIPYPEIEFNEVDSLKDTKRGSGGYGSTGK